MHQLQSTELAELKKAKKLLENPNLAIKITNYIGIPIEKAMNLLQGVLPAWGGQGNSLSLQAAKQIHK